MRNGEFRMAHMRKPMIGPLTLFVISRSPVQSRVSAPSLRDLDQYLRSLPASFPGSGIIPNRTLTGRGGQNGASQTTPPADTQHLAPLLIPAPSRCSGKF